MTNRTFTLPTRRVLPKVIIASNHAPRAARPITLARRPCEVIGVEGLSEADALARLRGLRAPAVPLDLRDWLRAD